MQFWVNPGKTADQTDIYEECRIGQRVVFQGKCSEPEKPSNPGQFDSRTYYLARNVRLLMKEVSLKDRQPGNGRAAVWYGYLNLLSDTREFLLHAMTCYIPAEDEALTKSILLGNRSGLSPETRRLFQDGGLMHILTISSLHLSILARSVYLFLRKRGRSFAGASSAAAFVMVSYILMTGNSFSAQRAGVMFAFWLGSQIFGRTYDRLTALSAAALFTLLLQPYALWDSSFLLSFSCILSLEIIPPVLQKLCPVTNGIGKSLTGSFSLQIGTLPVMLWFFYQTTPYAVFFSLMILPAMSLFMGFGIGAMAFNGAAAFLFSPAVLSGTEVSNAVSRVIACPCHFLILLFEGICRLERELPGSVLIAGRPALWQMVLYYAVLAGTLLRISKMSAAALRTERKGCPGRRPVTVRAALMLLAAAVILCIRIRPGFRYTCLDVGQGSANLIEQGDFTCLFDAGSSSVTDVWEYRISSTLRYYGIRKLDAVFLSHGDMDHINGAEQALHSYHRNLSGKNAGDVTIGRIYIPKLPDDSQGQEKLAGIRDGAGENHIPAEECGEGFEMRHGSLILKILAPSEKRLTGEANQDCLVMLLIRKNLRILLAGDLEKEGEKLFLEAYGKGEKQAEGRTLFGGAYDTFLAAGHHGSRNATSKELLELVKPDCVLFSAGKNNRYGHPAAETLERVEKAGIPYRRTDREGAVNISSG